VDVHSAGGSLGARHEWRCRWRLRGPSRLGLLRSCIEAAHRLEQGASTLRHCEMTPFRHHVRRPVMVAMPVSSPSGQLMRAAGFTHRRGLGQSTSFTRQAHTRTARPASNSSVNCAALRYVGHRSGHRILHKKACAPAGIKRNRPETCIVSLTVLIARAGFCAVQISP